MRIEETELHKSLKQLMGMIQSGQSSSDSGDSMTDILHRVDDLGKQLAGDLPPMLNHYLEKRSYTKALDFLEGHDDAKEPGC